MERVSFRLQVKPDRMDEYVRRHAQVWPEMLQALTLSGWNNYSLPGGRRTAHRVLRDSVPVGGVGGHGCHRGQRPLAGRDG